MLGLVAVQWKCEDFGSLLLLLSGCELHNLARKHQEETLWKRRKRGYTFQPRSRAEIVQERRLRVVGACVVW